MLTTETFRKAARDPAEFGSYYLSHYFTRRSPPFHRQLSALWRRRVMKNRDPVSDCAAMLTEKGTRSAIGTRFDSKDIIRHILQRLFRTAKIQLFSSIQRIFSIFVVTSRMA